MNIIITGTRKGIGRQLSEYFVNQGHKVAGCSRGDSDFVHEKYTHYILDVANDKEVASMVKREAIHGIDCLINNAGIASMNHLMLMPTYIFDNILGTNVLGSFNFIREVAKVMQKHRYGRIINFSTVAKPLDLEGELAYASSKAAVETMTRIASKELASFGITVNAISPTPVPTDLIKSVPKDKIDHLMKQQSIKRFGNIEDITNVLEFFMSPRSDFITGQILRLGGV